MQLILYFRNDIIIKINMKFRLKGSEQKFDHLRETAYCIEFSKEHIATKKKQLFLNKLSFDYSLQKVNEEKMYGRIIPLSSKIYPSTQLRGNKYCNHLYSSERVRMKKNIYNSRYQQVPQHKQEIRRYKHIISKKKNQQQGGIDSFWMFKKDPAKEGKKKPKGKDEKGQENQQQNLTDQLDQTSKAYIKILTFAKQPLDLENSLIPRNVFKNYVSSIIGQTFCLWFINFYQIKTYLNYKEFQILVQRFRNISLRECHLVSFFLYDDNGDGFLCPRDIFAIFQRQLNEKIDNDILSIGKFVKNNLGREDNVKEEFKIQHICIRDDWLTVKDYEMYYRKVDEPYLKATNKKDTVFSKSFAVLDHRQNVRSKRREMNEKKSYFDELFGEITKKKQTHPYVDSQQDYKLNYSLLYQLFGRQSTQLFKFFISTLFGIENKTF